jgi:hypothetical protein
MKKLSVNELEKLSAGYCDPLIYMLTGECTNAGCIIAGVWNSVNVTVTVTVNGNTYSASNGTMYCLM